MERKTVVLMPLLLVLAIAMGTNEVCGERLSLEPKESTWELNVELEDIGVLDIRGIPDLYIVQKEDKLARILGREDLPPKKKTGVEIKGAVWVPTSTAKRYVYFVFSIQNLTQSPIMDPSTELPRIGEDGKVIYEYVPITTLKVIPDEIDLEVKKIQIKIGTAVAIFMEMDEQEGEITERGLWPKRISAIDVLLEQDISVNERIEFNTGVPYLNKFFLKTGEYAFAKGTNVLPEKMAAKKKIRGVAFFAGLPDDIDKYSLYFSGISNRYRVKREGREKVGYYKRMVRFSFNEAGDEFEISRDILRKLKKERIYRDQYMGLYRGQRRLIQWDEERKAIERQGMSDPVEKWVVEEAMERE